MACKLLYSNDSNSSALEITTFLLPLTAISEFCDNYLIFYISDMKKPAVFRTDKFLFTLL